MTEKIRKKCKGKTIAGRGCSLSEVSNGLCTMHLWITYFKPVRNYKPKVYPRCKGYSTKFERQCRRNGKVDGYCFSHKK